MTILLQKLPRTTEYEFREVAAGNVLKPAFGGSNQPLGRKGDHWAWDVIIPAHDARACGMKLFADLIRGKREPIVMAVPDRTPARDYGAPVMDGVVAGNAVPLRGLTPNVTVPVKWMTLIVNGQRFLYLTADAVIADANGKAVVPITNLLRRPTVNGGVVELAKPMVEGFVPAGQSAKLSTLSALGLQFTIEERD